GGRGGRRPLPAVLAAARAPAGLLLGRSRTVFGRLVGRGRLLGLFGPLLAAQILAGHMDPHRAGGLSVERRLVCRRLLRGRLVAVGRLALRGCRLAPLTPAAGAAPGLLRARLRRGPGLRVLERLLGLQLVLGPEL